MVGKYIFNKILSRSFLVMITCIILIATAFSASTTTFTQDDNGVLTSISQLDYVFSFCEPRIDKITYSDIEYSKLSMSGCIGMGMNSGNPKLPVKFIKLLIPPNKDVLNIKVSGMPQEFITEGVNLIDNPLVPHQNPVPVGFSEPEEFEINNELYSSDFFYPNKLQGDYNIGHSRGYTILDMSLNPVQYNPKIGKVVYYPELTVEIASLTMTGVQYVNVTASDSFGIQEIVITLKNSTWSTDWSVSDTYLQVELDTTLFENGAYQLIVNATDGNSLVNSLVYDITIDNIIVSEFSTTLILMIIPTIAILVFLISKNKHRR